MNAQLSELLGDKALYTLKMKRRKTSCLKCHRCCEVLVCSNQGCPIVIHESCMPCAAHFDNAGSFYCPYCLYKQSLVECHQAKENALLANKALDIFLDTRTKNDAEHLQNSNFLKRKKSEAPTIVKKSNDACGLKVNCNSAHQSMQVKDCQQNDCRFLKTLSANQQEAGKTKGHCLGKGFAAKEDEDLTKNFPVSVKRVEGSGKQKDVQTQAGLRIEDSTNEIQEKEVNKGGYSRIAYEDIFKLKSPKSDIILSTEDTALLTPTSKDLTNDNEETAKIREVYYNRGIDRELKLISSPETPWCLTFKDTLKMSKKSEMGNAFQDCCLRTHVVENFDQPAEHGEDSIVSTGEEDKKAKIVISMRNDEKPLLGGKSEKLSVKDLEIEQALEKFHRKSMGKVQAHEEPKEISVFNTRVDNSSVVIDKADDIKDSAYQYDYSIIRKVMVKPENITPFSRVREDLCQSTDEGWTNFKSPNNDAYPTREYNESVKHVKSRDPMKENKEPSTSVEGYNSQVEEVQSLKDSQEAYVPLAELNTTAITKELDKVKDTRSRDDYYFPRNERVEIFGNADRPDDTGKDCYRSSKGITTQEGTLQDHVHPTRDDNVTAEKHELENLTKQHPITNNELKGCNSGVAPNEQTEHRRTRDDDKQEMVEKSDAGNCSSFQDECFLKRELVMHRKYVDRIAPQITRNENASVSCEEFGLVDDSESCTSNSVYLSSGVYAVEKRQMKKNSKNSVQNEKSSRCSENEAEEFEISTRDRPRHKVKSIKQIQRSTSLPTARRRKLPWTAQEIETLKEGVQKISVKANKNLPWLKILDFGRHIFDGTRTPVDLKDKWKRMKGQGYVNSDAK